MNQETFYKIKMDLLTHRTIFFAPYTDGTQPALYKDTFKVIPDDADEGWDFTIGYHLYHHDDIAEVSSIDGLLCPGFVSREGLSYNSDYVHIGGKVAIYAIQDKYKNIDDDNFEEAIGNAHFIKETFEVLRM